MLRDYIKHPGTSLLYRGFDYISNNERTTLTDRVITPIENLEKCKKILPKYYEYDINHVLELISEHINLLSVDEGLQLKNALILYYGTNFLDIDPNITNEFVYYDAKQMDHYDDIKNLITRLRDSANYDKIKDKIETLAHKTEGKKTLSNDFGYTRIGGGLYTFFLLNSSNMLYILCIVCIILLLYIIFTICTESHNKNCSNKQHNSYIYDVL